MNLNNIRDLAYKNAVEHGWHETERPIEHWLCLIIGELSEAVEADRKYKRADYDLFRANINTQQPEGSEQAHWDYCFEHFIKDTVEDELADVVIRALDLAGTLNVDLENVPTVKNYINNKAPEDFTSRIYSLQEQATHIVSALRLVVFIQSVFTLAADYEIQLRYSISLKMTYNEHRPYKHGKKY